MAAFLKFLKPRPKASINLMAERFQHLFEAHNLDVSQIPRLVPQITYDDLASPRQLLKALTPTVIDAIANLFGVRSQWLQGQEDTVYDRIWASKHPEAFLSRLSESLTVGNTAHWFPLRVLTTSMKLDRQARGEQLLLPVIVESVGAVGEDEVRRCRISGSYYDWTYPPSRLELKAIALLAYRHLDQPIPLMQVTPKEMEQFADGSAIPSIAWRKAVITQPSLEDFVSTREDHHFAKEIDELPELLRYIDKPELRDFKFATPASPGVKLTVAEPVVEDPTVNTPAPIKTPTSGKRQAQKEQWSAIIVAAQSGWSEDPTVTITAMVQRLQKMPHLKASALGESAIRKHIQAVAPLGVRGKLGRKSKQSI